MEEALVRFYVIWLQTPGQRNFVTVVLLFSLYHLQPELKDRDDIPVLLEGF
jgi:hypothetical protein